MHARPGQPAHAPAGTAPLVHVRVGFRRMRRLLNGLMSACAVGLSTHAPARTGNRCSMQSCRRAVPPRSRALVAGVTLAVCLLALVAVAGGTPIRLHHGRRSTAVARDGGRARTAGRHAAAARRAAPRRCRRRRLPRDSAVRQQRRSRQSCRPARVLDRKRPSRMLAFLARHGPARRVVSQQGYGGVRGGGTPNGPRRSKPPSPIRWPACAKCSSRSCVPVADATWCASTRSSPGTAQRPRALCRHRAATGGCDVETRLPPAGRGRGADAHAA